MNVTLVVLLLVLALGAPGVALANNWGSPMTFKIMPNGAIAADGDIEADTPERLEAFLKENNVQPNAELEFTSRGGNLAAGIRMGRIIRAHRLHTFVVSDTKIAGLYKPPPGCEGEWWERKWAREFSLFSLTCLDLLPSYPGYCISACTFAFLGGTLRGIWEGSIYAVHQAALECRDPTHARSSENSREDANVPLCPDAATATANAQDMAGGLIAFVQEMGVDPGFLTEAFRTENPARLSEAEMKKYRIIYRPEGALWSLESTPAGEVFLQQITTTEWKTNYIRFICRRNPDPRLVIMVTYDPANASGSEDLEKIIASGQLGLELHYIPSDWSQTHNNWWELPPNIVLGPEEIIRYPFLTGDGKVELVILASRRVLDALHTTYFGIYDTQKDFVELGGPIRSTGRGSTRS